MKNIFICLFAMFFLSNCTDDKDELIIGEPNNDKENILPDEGEGIEKKLFEVINLDYKGLEKVKQYYEAGNYQLAANALLDYYRMYRCSKPECNSFRNYSISSGTKHCKSSSGLSLLCKELP